MDRPDGDLRRQLEASVAPVARSLDGRGFELEASVDAPVQPGSYVELETAGAPVLGQVIESRMELREGPEVVSSSEHGSLRTRTRFHVVTGSGRVFEEAQPFHDAAMRAARPDEVAAWLERTAPARARLEIGELVFAPGVPLRLDAGGFGRHTFLCGQSGSGKSYALSVMLERLLLETELRVVVLDPTLTSRGSPARGRERIPTWPRAGPSAHRASRRGGPAARAAAACTSAASTWMRAAGRRLPSWIRCATATSTRRCSR